MNAQEKKLIYNLLKTADAFLCGYTRKEFQNEMIVEEDKIQNTLCDTGFSPPDDTTNFLQKS